MNEGLARTFRFLSRVATNAAAWRRFLMTRSALRKFTVSLREIELNDMKKTGV